jgi:hypothetical protein
MPLVYDELRKLAAEKMAQEKPGQTLQATALFHEAYLRLVDTEAEQQQPVRRKVALKVIKPGMDTRQVVVRFEAERQALALRVLLPAQPVWSCTEPSGHASPGAPAHRK